MMNKEQFSLLYSKYLDDTLTPEEEKEFYQAVHEGHFDHELQLLATRSWEESKTFQQPPTQEGLLRIQQVMSKITPKPKKIIPRWGWMAAASIILIVAGILIYRQVPGPSRPQALLHKIVTVPGEKKIVYLPDSSVVHMNPATTLTYHDNTPRSITLSGEAFFNVTHNPDQPFTVAISDGVHTKVLGTSFNIKNYPEEKKIDISVVTGKVSVSRNDIQLGLLTKDMHLIFDREHATTNIEQSGWRQGIMIFKFNTLEEVVATLERTYGCRIHIDKAVAGKRKLNAEFEEKQGIEVILGLIGDLHGLDIKRKENNELEIYNRSAGTQPPPAS